MAGRQTLNLLILVRIQVPEPKQAAQQKTVFHDRSFALESTSDSENIGMTNQFENQIPTDLIERLLAEYDLSTVASLQALRVSTDNIVILVRNNPKKVLRISKRATRHNFVFEYEFMQRCTEYGIPVAAWNKTRSGEIAAKVGDMSAVLFDFVRGSHADPTNQFLFLAQAQAAATQLGAVATIDAASVQATPERSVTAELERAIEVRAIFAGEIEGGKEFLEAVEWALDLAKGSHETTALLHNDFRISNVLFDEQAVTGILDFDWSCTGPAIKDLAHAALEWSFPDGAAGPDQKIMSAFINAYYAAAGGKPATESELRTWMRFAALIDTATYFCDRIQAGTAPSRVASSYMYKKYLYLTSMGQKES